MATDALPHVSADRTIPRPPNHPPFYCEYSKNTVVYGIHHKTALTACQIVANNSFAGYLALDRTGVQKVIVPLDGLLTENQYFFIVDGNDNYAIVPSFQDWRFPEESLPKIWPSIPDLALPHSSICSVTNVTYAVDNAYVVPQEEIAWYRLNLLIHSDIEDEGNIIPLRKDLHECFNNGWFAVVPKVAPDGSCQYVTHILGNRVAQIWPTYQNITIQRLLFESKAHLFSRFAWAIFQRVRNFIISGVPRRVNRLHIHDEEGYPEWKDEEAIGPLLTLLYGKEDTRNFKRKRLHSNGDSERSFASDGWASDNETENRPDLSDDVHKELKISVASLISSQYQQEIERSTLM